MASAAVMGIVRARVGALWVTTPVFYPNEQQTSSGLQTPADGSPFLEVQYPVSGEDQKSIGNPGNNIWREMGAIRFVLQIPRGAGVETYVSWLDGLRTNFRGKTLGSSGEMKTFQATPAVLDDRNDSGNYWSISSSVAYWYDIHS